MYPCVHLDINTEVCVFPHALVAVFIWRHIITFLKKIYISIDMDMEICFIREEKVRVMSLIVGVRYMPVENMQLKDKREQQCNLGRSDRAGRNSASETLIQQIFCTHSRSPKVSF